MAQFNKAGQETNTVYLVTNREYDPDRQYDAVFSTYNQAKGFVVDSINAQREPMDQVNMDSDISMYEYDIVELPLNPVV